MHYELCINFLFLQQIHKMKPKKYLFLVLFINVWMGCKKETTPDSYSNNKSLLSIDFKAADNPTLTGDVAGTITGDSVKVSFSSQVNLSSLVPTIKHDGLSINPPNKTVQNFSSPVTYTVTAQNGSTKEYIITAKNVSLADSISLSLGKWKIIKDSVSVINYYHSCGGTTYYPIPGVYIGTSSDYWDFKANNIIELNYYGNILSGGYQFISGLLKTWDQCYTNYAQILVLNTTTATFYYTKTSPNGGHWGRMVWLKR